MALIHPFSSSLLKTYGKAELELSKLQTYQTLITNPLGSNEKCRLIKTQYVFV
jgi:hypothetical protein